MPEKCCSPFALVYPFTPADAGVDLDESKEWGGYNPRSDSRWYNILSNDPENTYRWFLQLGFGTWILSRYGQEDLPPGKHRRKSVSESRCGNSSRSFPKFTTTCANFGYIPSISRWPTLLFELIRLEYTVRASG